MSLRIGKNTKLIALGVVSVFFFSSVVLLQHIALQVSSLSHLP